MLAKIWIVGWFAIVITTLVCIGGFVYRIDPYFHYHKPDIENYYYLINNQRHQNNGISRHFEYDALITGTSMTENFKTSELDEIFGVSSVKAPYSGGSYKEINENLKVALRYHPNLKMVVRGIDVEMFFDSPDRMRNDLGDYPAYLYDNNLANDVNYLFNKDVIFARIYSMEKARHREDFSPGITSFDDYSQWPNETIYGHHSVVPNDIAYHDNDAIIHLTKDEKDTISSLITQHVTSLADEYPNTDFYYFFTPYSIYKHMVTMENGELYKQIEAEQYIIELILEHKNIKLFSFNALEEIVTDLNHYKDARHYGGWINSYMLRCMYDNKYRLTPENYQSYLNNELDLFLHFDYKNLKSQVDYANDKYAAALLNESIWRVKPINVTEEYLSNTDYVDESESISLKHIGKHNYLVFYGKRISGQGQSTIAAFDEKNHLIVEVPTNYSESDDEWHQYLIDLSETEGDVTVYFNRGTTSQNKNQESKYIFKDIILY